MDNKKVFNRKFLVTGVFLVLLIGFGVVLGLFVSGRLAVLWKQPRQQVVLINRVCDDDVVTTYNKVSQYTQQRATGESTIDEKGLKNLATDIKSRQNYQGDPTCQIILLAVAIHNKDYNAAKEAYNAAKDLHDKHLYVDSNLKTIGSLSAYEIFIQELSPSKQGSDNQEPKGGA